MGLSRKQASIFYTVILILGLGIGHFEIGNYTLIGVLLTSVLGSVLLYLVIIPYCCLENERLWSLSVVPNHSNQSHVQSVQMQPIEEDEHIAVTPVSERHDSNGFRMIPKTSDLNLTKRRLYYIDNVRAILIMIVVLHNVTCIFAGSERMHIPYKLAHYHHSFQVPGNVFMALNQSYFICLFFFISGYFTPFSYDTKGPRQFMKDKLKRLGVPFLVYTLFVGPLLDLVVKLVFINNGSTYTYIPSAGPCWFLGWLLIFNACYLVMDQTVPVYVARIPSLLKLVLIGILLSIPQLMLVWFVVPNGFILMPITIGSLPYDILFFCGGVMAKRNEWLRSLNRFNFKVVVFLILLFIVFWVIMISAMYAADLGTIIPKKDLSTDCNADTDESEFVYNTVVVLSGICCFVESGAGTMVMPLGLILFAEKYLNYQSKWTLFFSQQSYAVYLIHPPVLCLVAWTWVKIMELATGLEMAFCIDSVTSSTALEKDSLVYLGWFYSAVLSMLIVWPMAWCIRKIPRLNKII